LKRRKLLNKAKTYFSLYFVLSLTVITVQLMGIHTLENFLKPLLMPTLIIGYFWLKDSKFQKFDYLIIAALFFSMLGDSFLMPYFNIFMAGLGSFLVAHIFYLIAFIPEIKAPIHFDFKKRIFALIAFLFYASLIITLFWKLISISASPLLIISIGIYATILYTVFISALLRNTSTAQSHQLILIGAALFLLSDGLLAFNKFVNTIPFSRLWVMSSYTAAQAFIVYGSIKRSN